MEENKIITYSYFDENHKEIKYFIGSDIALLLGYKNTTQAIQRIVSEENKISFKNYLGVKEPKINSRQILINDNGIYELLNKNKKTISDEAITFLKNVNIDTSMISNEEVIDDCQEEYKSKNEDELTIYEYISNGLLFEYFVGFEIVSLLGYKNVAQTIMNIVSKSNILIFNDYPGVKLPKLDPKTILITRDGAIEILLKTRKRISPDVSHILKKFNIETTNKKCLTKEQQTLSAITNAFKTEKFEDQYKIGKYYLDLYFPEYKIVVECDENGHSDRKPYDERERMDFVNENLNIDDSYWIRYNPDEYDFDISKVIGKIYRKITSIKEENNKASINSTINEDDDKKEKLIIFTKDDLEIEPITGKIKAPPKEFLIQRINNGDSMLKIGQLLGISSKPVVKWLKEYDIKLNHKDNYKPPPKDELIKLFETKNQTEVAEHYKQSTHIIRKWLKNYELDLTKLKTENKVNVDKEVLINLLNEGKELNQIADELNITELQLNKYIKIHNIDRIPNKKELEELIKEKSRDDIAKIYNTTRTTLRKWLQTYDLDDIKRSSCKRSITVIGPNNVSKEYESIKDLCKELHISHSKVYDCADTGEIYNGNKFIFHDNKDNKDN